MLQFAPTVRSIITACGCAVASGVLAVVAATSPTLAAPCASPGALGTSRTLVVDPAEHIRLGAMQYRETLPLRPHEVVLTFDDGPLPPYSNRILDVLAAECVKATYFMVGSMAKAYPHLVQRVAAEGHTIGTHSQNHPLTFNRMPLARAKREITSGIASVSAALGRPPAPFFRIPGLLRASTVEYYLATQGLMTWSADIVSDDWRRISSDEIVRRTLARLEVRGKGIVLMHDIHPATALALPKLLRELKARGYRIVHVVPASGDRIKTATLPDQWLARAAAIKPPVAALTPTGASTKRTRHGAVRSKRSRHGIRKTPTRRHEAVKRQREAAIVEEKAPATVAAVQKPQPPFSNSLLRQILPY
jgi:peptidoglycan-N-acetylglucosamine deacetylase